MSSEAHLRSEDDHPVGSPGLPIGSAVAVRCRFDGRWADGFEVVDAGDDDHGPFQVRRRSDDVVLPAHFGADDIRQATPSRDPWR